MKVLKRERKNITLIYSVQAQYLMNQFRDFNIDEFERDFADELIIGDKIISKYMLEKEAGRLKREKKNGSKCK